MARSELLRGIIRESKTLDLASAISELGTRNLVTLYDLARLWQTFFDEGKQEELTRGEGLAPSRPYFHCSEQFCIAPDWHPAAGKLIHAEISHVQNGKVYPSIDEYKILDIALDSHGQATGYIIDFQVEGSLVTPVFDLSAGAAWQERYCRNVPLHILMEGDTSTHHLALRPVSWHKGLAFTTANNVRGSLYTAVDTMLLPDSL